MKIPKASNHFKWGIDAVCFFFRCSGDHVLKLIQEGKLINNRHYRLKDSCKRKGCKQVLFNIHALIDDYRLISPRRNLITLRNEITKLDIPTKCEYRIPISMAEIADLYSPFCDTFESWQDAALYYYEGEKDMRKKIRKLKRLNNTLPPALTFAITKGKRVLIDKARLAILKNYTLIGIGKIAEYLFITIPSLRNYRSKNKCPIPIHDHKYKFKATVYSERKIKTGTLHFAFKHRLMTWRESLDKKHNLYKDPLDENKKAEIRGGDKYAAFLDRVIKVHSEISLVKD